MHHKVPLRVLLFDRWYLAAELVSMARYRKKDGISRLKKQRNLETTSVVLKDAAGEPLRLEGPHIAVESLVSLLPPTASHAVTVGETTSWTFTLAVRIAGLGQVRLVVSFEKAEVTGTYAVLVTNRVDWHAHRIITLYVQRWPIGVSREGHMNPVGESPTEVRSSSLVAWEAPWRAIKTVKPSDTMLLGSMRNTPGCNVQ